MKCIGVIKIVTYKISNFDGQKMECIPWLVHLDTLGSTLRDKGPMIMVISGPWFCHWDHVCHLPLSYLK